jgi:TrmH family RNA methyltransferase
MIQLYKLEKLPRTQRLRKITKVFTFAENRLCASFNKNETRIYSAAEFSNTEPLGESERTFLADAVKLLAQDALFSPDAQKVFREASDVFQSAFNSRSVDAVLLRRVINSVKHILLNETGRDQADWDFTCADGTLNPVKRQVFEGMLVYMEDIRSPFNVGAMFRTAESFGVEKIFLSPLCADPRHRRAERTAMGCVDIVPWERRELFPAPDSGKLPDSDGLPYPVFALETGGIPLTEFPFPPHGLLIAGSEELGVSPRALSAADASLGRVSIPCYGAKASLNVSVAFGIAVQAWGQVNAARRAVDE